MKKRQIKKILKLPSISYRHQKLLTGKQTLLTPVHKIYSQSETEHKPQKAELGDLHGRENLEYPETTQGLLGPPATPKPSSLMSMALKCTYFNEQLSK